MVSNKIAPSTLQIIALIAVVSTALLFGNYFVSSRSGNDHAAHTADPELMAKFDALSKNGNSTCSGAFTNSISSMANGTRLQGSCCSPMSFHRYTEQIEGLKKFANISEIPPDPYDIDANLAAMLMSFYDAALTSEQQKAYDYAMANSHEKGPCCCKCWRWYVYGGLAKILITRYNFTGQQVTEVWNLSDGCGGDEHLH